MTICWHLALSIDANDNNPGALFERLTALIIMAFLNG